MYPCDPGIKRKDPDSRSVPGTSGNRRSIWSNRRICKASDAWKTSLLEDVDTDSLLFRGLEKPVQVARYHSLAVEEDTLPKELKVTARSKDGEVMAMEHEKYPIYGVQFHPESVMTPKGFTMIKNFIEKQ